MGEDFDDGTVASSSLPAMSFSKVTSVERGLVPFDEWMVAKDACWESVVSAEMKGEVVGRRGTALSAEMKGEVVGRRGTMSHTSDARMVIQFMLKEAL